MLTPWKTALGRDTTLICSPLLLYGVSLHLCLVGIPMEEDEDERDTSIRGRLLMLVNKIKGQSHKAEAPMEKEQAAPCEEATVYERCFQ